MIIGIIIIRKETSNNALFVNRVAILNMKKIKIKAKIRIKPDLVPVIKVFKKLKIIKNSGE